MAARLQAPRAAARPVTTAAPARRVGMAWPRLPPAVELAATGAPVTPGMPYLSWTIAVIVSTATEPGVTTVIALPRPARHGGPAGSP